MFQDITQQVQQVIIQIQQVIILMILHGEKFHYFAVKKYIKIIKMYNVLKLQQVLFSELPSFL